MNRTRLLTVPASAFVAPVATLAAYLGVITGAALLPRRSSTTSAQRRSFAIMIPAYDEAPGITRALEACARLDYPTDRFSVHVVADNCTDATAQVARACGVEVHERFDPLDPGKGPALNWLIDQVEAAPERPDAYVIVDADTVLDADFLSAMDLALDEGAHAAQGFYSVLEPEESAAAGLRAAALACRHHMRPLGRNRLGGSCGLYGNGMVFTREVMAERRWTGHLVEDAEFQMELLLDGIPVEYVPGARLDAEMPDTLDGATTQNQRWELGRIQMARRYVPQLVGRALRRSNRQRRAEQTVGRIAYLDAIFDLLVPPLSVLVAADMAAVGIAGSTRLARDTGSTRWILRSAAMSTIILGAHVVLSLRAVRAPRSVYRALYGAPRAAAWKVGLWFDVLRAPDDVSWVRTRRNTDDELGRDHESGQVTETDASVSDESADESGRTMKTSEQ